MIQTWPAYDDKTVMAADALVCRRGGRTVFAGVSFRVTAGQYLCVRGRNGAGKSTLLRLIAGLVPASGGNVDITAFAGDDVRTRDTMMMVGYLNGLKPTLSLRDNAIIFYQLMTGRMPGDEALECAAAAFSLMQLLDQPVQYFSSGQRHRSALMRLALVPRQIWLMDEPTVGLDAENRLALEQVMKAHLVRGGIIISATHDPINVPGDVLNLDDIGKPAFAQPEGMWL